MAATFSQAASRRVDLGSNLDAMQNQTEVTLMGWFNLSAYPTGGQVATVAGFSTGTSSTGSRLAIRMTATPEFQIACRRLDADALIQQTVAGSGPNLNQWYHFAAVADYDSQLLSMYVDGALLQSVAQASWTGAVSNTTSQLAAIGATTDGSTNFLTGDIADVRLYRRALTAAEIAAIYHARGADRVRHSLYHHWRFDNVAPGVSLGASSVVDYGVGNKVGSGINGVVGAAAPLRLRSRVC